MRYWVMVVMLCVFGGVMPVANAEALKIEVIGRNTNLPALLVPNFAQESLLGGSLGALVRQDLARMGRFSVLDSGAFSPATASDIPFQAWRDRGAIAMSVGRVMARDGQFEVEISVLDAARQHVLNSAKYTILPTQSRQLAHQIADFIYETLTKKRGIASTKIAFVNRQNEQYLLQIADWDGANAQTILRSLEPIMSPAWSPDGSRLAYVSFETQKPVVFVHHVSTGQRVAVANFRGSNSAPAWSADGQQLALVLTVDGRSQIYSIPATGGTPTRLVTSSGIDTEPVFAPDGRLFFTSDRAGSPQIYVRTQQGAVTRVTFSGAYNVSPALSPDGSALAFVRRVDGRFRIVLLNRGDERFLSTTHEDESPSFAPNGELLLYVSGGALYTMSLDGQTRTRLSTPSGEISAPAWGRFVQ